MRTIFLCLMALLYSDPIGSTSYSDFAREEFEKGPAALAPVPRSPFLPGLKNLEDLDPSALAVEGIIYGPKIRMALLSGRIFREGDTLGKYRVKKIDPDLVSLEAGEMIYPLRLSGFVPSGGAASAYLVEFRGAKLRDALTLLALADGLNIVVPETFAGEITVSLRNIELLQAIRSILRVNGYDYAQEAGILRVGKPEDFAGGTDLMIATFPLKYATAKDLVTPVKTLLSDRGQVIADDRTNVLTVKDRDPIVANIRTLLTTIDRRDRQVKIEARIVDATREFSRAVGIRWGVTGTRDNVTISGTQDVGKSKDTETPLNVNLGADNPVAGVGLIIGKLAGAIDIEAQLTAAESKGNVKILSKPTVTTLNNMPAKIRSGTKIYVKSTSTISLGTAGGTAASGDTGGLQEIDTGIELTVTPQITVENTIKLKIDASQSEADFSRTVDGIPAVIDSTASTTVLLEDGATTVIGGLYRVRSSQQRKGVPGLMNVPVVGYLFHQRSRTRTDTELMIFITPKVVGP